MIKKDDLKKEHSRAESSYSDVRYLTEITRLNNELVNSQRELNRLNAELIKQKDELEALMDAVPATIWISRDAAGTDMIGNKAVQELLGLPPEANVSESAPEDLRPQHFLAYRDDRVIPTDELPMQKAGRTGEPVLGVDFEFRFDDGQFGLGLWQCHTIEER